MNGIHDCGGMEGFGPIEQEAEDTPKFKHDWERQIFGLHWGLAALGNWNIDEIRHAIERMGNLEYLATPYYEHWLAANEILLVEKGVITAEELASAQDAVRAEMTAGRG